jgi:putative DNA primase/helicase
MTAPKFSNQLPPDIEAMIDAGKRQAGTAAQGKPVAREEPPPPNGPDDYGIKRGERTNGAASTYEMRGIMWFWNNRFAIGKLGLIGGLPDRGKGLITSHMIAKATMGGDWPCGEGRAIRGNVLILTAEDDIEDTIIPRLVAAGADLTRVHIVKMVRQDGDKRMFSLVTDLALLRQKIDEIGDVVLIVIDPISAYLGVGKIDAYRATDVRGMLSPLTDMAAEKKLLIIGVMHFNKKADVHNAMLRIADSLAFVAAARHCYVVVDDPEKNRRLFVKARNNLAPDMAALSYTVDTITVGKDSDTRETISAPHVVWGSEHVHVTATEAMQAEETATGSSSHSGARDTAKKFLAEILANGPVPKGDIEEAAEANCIATRTLERAKTDLGIVARKAGIKGGWTWQLPEQKPPLYDS